MYLILTLVLYTFLICMQRLKQKFHNYLNSITFKLLKAQKFRSCTYCDLMKKNFAVFYCKYHFSFWFIHPVSTLFTSVMRMQLKVLLENLPLSALHSDVIFKLWDCERKGDPNELLPSLCIQRLQEERGYQDTFLFIDKVLLLAIYFLLKSLKSFIAYTFLTLFFCNTICH